MIGEAITFLIIFPRLSDNVDMGRLEKVFAFIRKSKQARIALIATGLVIVGLFFLFPKTGSDLAITKGESQRLPAVALVESQSRDLKKIFRTFGTLQSWKEVSLKPAPQTTIREIPVRVGQEVALQQVLMISGSEAQNLRLELESIDFELKNLDFSVTMALAKKNFLSKKEVKQRGLEHRASLLRTQLNKLDAAGFLRSPIKGLVAEVGFKAGDFFDGNSNQIIKVVDNSKLKVPLYVPQEVVAFLKVDQAVTLKRPQQPDISAVLSTISPSVDAKTGSVFVELVVDQVPPQILSGMYVEIEFSLENAEAAISVPLQALVYENGKPFLYKFETQARSPASKDDLREVGRVAKIPVETGVQEGDFVQILKGLQELEEVVIQGHGSLSNGSDVEVIR